MHQSWVLCPSSCYFPAAALWLLRLKFPQDSNPIVLLHTVSLILPFEQWAHHSTCGISFTAVYGHFRRILDGRILADQIKGPYNPALSPAMDMLGRQHEGKCSGDLTQHIFQPSAAVASDPA